jgi:murein DD-endopeptidase MepM/ murein hydrolase activator NlpD
MPSTMYKKIVCKFVLCCLFLTIFPSCLFSMDPVTVTVAKDSAGVSELIGKNTSYAPVTITLYCRLINSSANVSLPLTVVLAPFEIRGLLEITPDSGSRSTFTYYFRSQLGDYLHASHNDSVTYRLPFNANNCVRVIQGYNGKFSHSGERALDFDLPTGTPVLAARDGTVVEIKQDSDAGCGEVKCAADANKIVILHTDGSLAYYTHLKFNGVIIKLGQEVTTGQQIGYSGNTGFSSQPHLDFKVMVPTLERKMLRGVATYFVIKKKRKILEMGDCVNAFK